MSQLVIISRSLITRLRGQCSQLDTLPLIIEYIVFWGLSAHKVGPSHATRRGGVCGTHTLRPLFSLFIMEGGRGGAWRVNASRCRRRRSHAILAWYCARCARLYTRERGIACARQRERSVRNACTDGKFPESFVLRLVRWQLPPVWGKAADWNPDWFKWQLLLIPVAKKPRRCNKVKPLVWLQTNPGQPE